MSHPRVVKKGEAGYDVYCGRCARHSQASAPPEIWRWGNPFEIGRDGTRAQVIRKFENWLRTGDSTGCSMATEDRRQWMLGHLPELSGKVLACWCAPLDCHCDILAAMADELERDT